MILHDINPPKNSWERAYIRFEYERMGLNQVGQTPILLSDSLYICIHCGKINDYFINTCEECDIEMDSWDNTDER